MSKKYFAIEKEHETCFGAPASYGYNKNDFLHDPKNPFPHIFMFAKLDDPCSNYVLIDDFPPSSYTDITEILYKKYKEFWGIKE